MGASGKKIRVVFFQRKRRHGANFSVEIYFEMIRNSLPAEFSPELVIMPFESSGFFKRLVNTIYCIFKQGDINHITGDIHYVGIFLRKKKTVLTILDCGMLKHASGLKLAIYKLFWYTLPAKRAAYISVISEATKQDLLRYIKFPGDCIHVIYVCISEAFKPVPSALNKQKPVILQIGTAENKNLRRLIPAIAGLSCKLVIVGRIGEEISALLAQHKIDYTNLIGISEAEVIENYQKADIISFVSMLEGFGMPIVEANAVGRCVITGNVSSMPEIAGDAALMVDPFSVDAIRNGIIKLINDDAYRTSLINNGFENCRRFSRGAIVEQFSDLYRTMAAEQVKSLQYEHQF